MGYCLFRNLKIFLKIFKLVFEFGVRIEKISGVFLFCVIMFVLVLSRFRLGDMLLKIFFNNIICEIFCVLL